MKISFILTFLLFICLISFTSAQDKTNLDSLEVTLENLSWKELDSIGKEYRNKYKLDKSEIYLKKALQVAEKQSDTLYANSCLELGFVFYYQSSFQKADVLCMKALEVIEKELGKKHLMYAKFCNLKARIYYIQGLYEKAEYLFVEARKINAEILGIEHLEYASSCYILASLLSSRGFYQESEALFLEAIKIQEKKIGVDHPSYSNSLFRLAVMYHYQGLYQKAETLYTEIIDTQKKIEETKSPLYSQVCYKLADLYSEQYIYDKAEPLYLESIKMLQSMGANIDYVYACGNLANMYNNQGLHHKAEPLYIEAKNREEKILGKESISYAISCSNLAILYMNKGLYQKAESLFLETKGIYEKILEKEHPDYALFYANLASLYTNQSLYHKAKPLYLEALQNKKNQIKLLFPTLSESEKQEYFTSIKYFFTNVTIFATHYYLQNRKISQDLFNQQLFTKGIIFSSTQKMKNQILGSKDSVLINQYEDWKKQKEEYISLFQTPISERDSTISLTQLASQINELEREISTKSELFRENTTQKEYTWQDAKQTLSENEAALEIIRLVKNNIQEKPIDTVYVAMIITDKTEESPELFVLEKGNEMENGAFGFYQNNIEFKLEDEDSYNFYWKPIQEKLDSLSKKNNITGYSKIYFSPDGVYHKLNLNTLQNPKTGKHLVEEQNIQLITSSRDLIERKEKGIKNVDLSKNYEGYKAYLLGYPSYKLDEADTLKVNGTDRSLNGLQRIIGQQTVVPVLEGTKVETNQINDLLTKKSISTTLFQNNEANEENIKALKSPTILHFATHGFFINAISGGEPKTLQEAEDRKLLKNPFLRSGLLLAGCQNPQTGQEDGILSAEEAMNLNLDGTELVVLSACETGLGDVHNGEGVYGLQRAFRQAGAKTVIMSLWKVNDEATQLLMTTFYESLLSGKTKREAFKMAKLKLKEKYSEPYYWGAFVMVGE